MLWHQVILQDQIIMEIIHCGESGDVSKLLEPQNKSPVLVITFLSQLNSTHTYLYLACLYFLSLYACTYLTQESN